MTIPLDQAVIALQFADSAFPSGAFTFSWGLEGLLADGLLDSRDDVMEVAHEQLTLRWAPMDRVFLTWAHAAPDEASLMEIDRLVEASTLSAPLRIGSRSAGRRLLGSAADMSYPGTISYRQTVRNGSGLGHLPVVQGLVFREAGMDLLAATLVSGWTALSGLVSAAVRLGVIGHRDAQDVLTRHRATLESLASSRIAADAEPWSFTPLLDIALARNDGRSGRLFTT